MSFWDRLYLRFFIAAGVFLSFICNFSFAQTVGNDLFAIASGATIEHDTLSLANQLCQVVYSNYMDSVRLIPSYEIYCQWDTTVIHPYHFDESTFHDTTYLVLKSTLLGGFVMPCPGKVNSNFGNRHHSGHFGIDLHLVTGDTVVGAFDGMVRIAKRNKSYGNVVIIRHANGLETIYAHLSKILVSANQTIKAGTPIGLGGNTGHSFGSHLHFETRYKGEPLNPEDLISFENQRLIADTAILTYKNFCTYYQCLNAYNARSRSRSKTRGNKQLAQVSHNHTLSHKTVQTVPTANKTGKKAAVATAYCTVKKGDTVYTIAKKFHTTPQKILQLNNIKSSTLLKVGSKLKCA